MKKYIFTFVIILAALLISNCFSPWRGDESGNLTIVWGSTGSARFIHTAEQLNDLPFYRITLTSPGKEKQVHEFRNAVPRASFSVAAGTWNVVVWGGSSVENTSGIGYIENLQIMGASQVEVKAGSKTTKQMDMYNAVEVSNWEELYDVIASPEEGFNGPCPYTGCNSIWHTQLIVLKSGESYVAGGTPGYGAIYINRPIVLVAEDEVEILRAPEGIFTDPFFSLQGEDVRLTLGLPGMSGVIRFNGMDYPAYQPLIYVGSNSRLEMNKGVLILNNNNESYAPGGGVLVDESGSFIMDGGEISGNYAENGGGVYVVTGATFDMKGGSITGNKVNEGIGLGAGVYVEKGGVFNQKSGATVKNNTPPIAYDVYRQGTTPTVFKISLVTENKQAGDSVSFAAIDPGNDPLVSKRGKAGDKITIYYNLDNVTTNNLLRFSNISSPPANISKIGIGTFIYTINAIDSFDGEYIYINAEFIHESLPLQIIDFPQKIVKAVYGDDPITRTASLIGEGNSNPISYMSDNPGVADVNSNTGVVTIYNAGSTTITATKPADSSYAEGKASYRLDVAQKPLTITATAPGNFTFAAVNYAPDTMVATRHYYGNQADITIGISGLINGDTINISIYENSNFSSEPVDAMSNEEYSLSLFYNGNEVPSATANIRLAINDYSSNYTWPEPLSFNVNVKDGHPGATFSQLNPNRRIPVNKDNFHALIEPGEIGDFFMDYRHYILMENIDDLPAYFYWNPIATNSEEYPFTGSFDGGGKSIIGLKVEAGDYALYLGMFGFIGTGAVVKNLTLIDADMRSSGIPNIGAIAAVNNGTIEYCSVSGTIVGGVDDYSTDNANAGGIAGTNNGIIRYCGFTEGSVYGIESVSYKCDNVGGITGYNTGTIEFCYFTASTDGVRNDNVGGIAGYNNGTIRNCYSSSKITGTDNTYNSITGRNYTGGIAGYNLSTIENCYSSIIIEGFTYAGGIAGLNGGTVQNSVALNNWMRVTGAATGKAYGRTIGTSVTLNNPPVQRNNYARSDMVFINSIGDTLSYPLDNSHEGIDGEAIAANSWTSQNWTSFWASGRSPTGWSGTGFTNVWWNGKLPTALPSIPMPMP